MPEIRFKSTTRTLECILTPDERKAKSDEAHNVTAVIVQKEAERDTHKARAAAAGKEIDQLTGTQRGLSECARTGIEPREVRVYYEYDSAIDRVTERREDTGEVLGAPRKPYAAERVEIQEVQQQQLDLEDPEEDPEEDGQDEAAPAAAATPFNPLPQQAEGQEADGPSARTEALRPKPPAEVPDELRAKVREVLASKRLNGAELRAQTGLTQDQQRALVNEGLLMFAGKRYGLAKPTAAESTAAE